jgi:hypothetical protein
VTFRPKDGSDSEDCSVLIIRGDNIYVKSFINQAGCYELTETAVQRVSDMSSHARLFPADFCVVQLLWDLKYTKLPNCTVHQPIRFIFIHQSHSIKFTYRC